MCGSMSLWSPAPSAMPTPGHGDALVEPGRVDLDALVSGHYAIDDIEQALTATRRDPATVKAVVRPGT